MAHGGFRAGAGRKSGSAGASTVEVRQFLARKNFDPIAKLVELYEHDETDHATKVKIAMELAQYVAPKLKAMDIKADVKQQSIKVVLGLAVRPKAVDTAISEAEKRLLEPRDGSSILDLPDSEDLD
jgi:hypothetical protein